MESVLCAGPALPNEQSCVAANPQPPLNRFGVHLVGRRAATTGPRAMKELLIWCARNRTLGTEHEAHILPFRPVAGLPHMADLRSSSNSGGPNY